MFRPTDTSIYGGNQARAIAGQQQQNRQAQEGMAQFESQLTQQDLQAQQQGRQQFAQARTQQRQTAAQRDAAIEQADMQYEAELESRRRQLGSTVANLAGTVAGSFLGPAGAAAGGAIAGGLAGGGMGAVQGAGAGFSTAFQRQQSQDFINQLTGGGQETTSETDTTQTEPSLSAETQQTFDFASSLMEQQPQQPSVPLQQPQGNPIQQDIDMGMGLDLGGQMDVPEQPDVSNLFSDSGQFINQLVSGVEQPQLPQITNRQQAADELNRLRQKGSDLTFEEFQFMEERLKPVVTGQQRVSFGQQEGYNTQRLFDDIGYGIGQVGEFLGDVGTRVFGTQQERYQQYTGQ